MKFRFRIAIWTLSIAAFIAFSIFAWWRYDDYTDYKGRHMTLPTFHQATTANTLIATYISGLEQKIGTPVLYISLATMHTGTKQFYSEKPFAEIDRYVPEIKLVSRLQGSNGEQIMGLDNGQHSSLRHIDTIPQCIYGLDTNDQVVLTLWRDKYYPENLKQAGKVSYLKEWRRVLFEE